MDKVIVYKLEDGSVAICVPTPECLLTHTIEEIATKDVPEGIPYKIVNISELPEYPADTWEVDDSQFDDGVGGASNLFPEDPLYGTL